LGGLTPPARRAAVHFAALVLQGVVVLLLLESARELPTATAVLGGFTLVGAAFAFVWFRWVMIPHTLDMCFGMLTLGNLGMLLGWWADNGFVPLHDGGCRACAEAARGEMMAPWMWAGMLLFANAAMLGLGRRPLPRGSSHVPAMVTGGNLGMVAGMVAGGWVAAHLPADSVPLAAAVGFAGMTAGMVAGMLLGTWLAEELIAAARAERRPPRGGAPSPASGILSDEIVRR
ncbi:MAG: copA 2, partial [Gemmataceae bacterium]|nr:copA 2 [Gemmataceae bacterium]